MTSFQIIIYKIIQSENKIEIIALQNKITNYYMFQNEFIRYFKRIELFTSELNGIKNNVKNKSNEIRIENMIVILFKKHYSMNYLNFNGCLNDRTSKIINSFLETFKKSKFNQEGVSLTEIKLEEYNKIFNILDKIELIFLYNLEKKIENIKFEQKYQKKLVLIYWSNNYFNELKVFEGEKTTNCEIFIQKYNLFKNNIIK